jgi:hypothetical protein
MIAVMIEKKTYNGTVCFLFIYITVNKNCIYMSSKIFQIIDKGYFRFVLKSCIFIIVTTAIVLGNLKKKKKKLLLPDNVMM